jgi:hypothetical protein
MDDGRQQMDNECQWTTQDAEPWRTTTDGRPTAAHVGQTTDNGRPTHDTHARRMTHDGLATDDDEG